MLHRTLAVLSALLLGGLLSPPARAQLAVSGGYSFLRSSALQNGAQNCPFVAGEFGIPVGGKGGIVGFFWQANFATNTAGASFNPMFYGFFLRALFGPKGKKTGFLEARFDPISLIYLLLRSGSQVNLDNILNVGFNVGARIALGKKVSLMPYLGFSMYSYPYLGSSSSTFPRYYSPELGIKLALE